MPLRLDSITNDCQNENLLTWIFQESTKESNDFFLTEDKKHLLIQRYLENSLTGETIGKLVYTIRCGEEALEVIDLDIVLSNNQTVLLRFEELLPGSSDANEYYAARLVDDDHHLNLETVNRHTVKGSIENTEEKAFVSVFPFRLTVFENIEAFNKWAGFGEGVKAGGTDLIVHGFSEKFMMPGGVIGGTDPDEGSYSFLLGKVVAFQDVEIVFGDIALPFVLALADTALGVVPVAMGREVFDLEQLRIGCILAMDACIKADLTRDDVFERSGR